MNIINYDGNNLWTLKKLWCECVYVLVVVVVGRRRSRMVNDISMMASSFVPMANYYQLLKRKQTYNVAPLFHLHGGHTIDCMCDIEQTNQPKNDSRHHPMTTVQMGMLIDMSLSLSLFLISLSFSTKNKNEKIRAT